MTDLATTRRTVLGGIAGAAALGAASRAAPPRPRRCPARPVALNVIDVAGQLQLTQGAIETFVQRQSQAGLQGQLLAGAGAGAAGQDQGAAGRRRASISTWC